MITPIIRILAGFRSSPVKSVFEFPVTAFSMAENKTGEVCLLEVIADEDGASRLRTALGAQSGCEIIWGKWKRKVFFPKRVQMKSVPSSIDCRELNLRTFFPLERKDTGTPIFSNRYQEIAFEISSRHGIPLLPHWSGHFVNRLKELELIKKVDSFGIDAWDCSNKRDLLMNALGSLIKGGDIKVEPAKGVVTEDWNPRSFHERRREWIKRWSMSRHFRSRASFTPKAMKFLLDRSIEWFEVMDLHQCGEGEPLDRKVNELSLKNFRSLRRNGFLIEKGEFRFETRHSVHGKTMICRTRNSLEAIQMQVGTGIMVGETVFSLS